MVDIEGQTVTSLSVYGGVLKVSVWTGNRKLSSSSRSGTASSRSYRSSTPTTTSWRLRSGGLTAEVTTAIGCVSERPSTRSALCASCAGGGNSGPRGYGNDGERPREPAGRLRTRLRAWSDRMVGLLGKYWWGVLIVFLPPASIFRRCSGYPRRTYEPAWSRHTSPDDPSSEP
jgi:hypothetical protein